MKRSRYTILSYYVGKEYIISFLVSFAFFFFIFFVNQILVLAQKILLKNVGITDVLTLVILSIPQFLLYTMPFSSLASASMVIGNFSSSNEITAMRSGGISLTRIFMPIVIISLFLSFSTLVIADRMIPYTSERYADLYVSVLEKLPTLEFEDYGSVRFGDIVVSNGKVDGGRINDIIIYDGRDPSDSHAIKAESAVITLVDAETFTYRIDLENAEILITDSSFTAKYSSASAGKMTLYLNLGSNSDVNFTLNPSQMSINQLLDGIKAGSENLERTRANYNRILNKSAENLGDSLKSIEANPDSVDYNNIKEDVTIYHEKEANKPFNFTYQYYLSELNKKFALSMACTFLVFIAFPISFFKVKYGRLTGFGLSIFVAATYWFYLYYMHTRAIVSTLNPALFLWNPNMIVFFVGLVLLWGLRRH
ncbi:MAG: LptF/LptG family permease [Sphaerochaetaceae bacterium]|nr:LptF/LptG family permease [Sphaerochaetaceae bacterium]